MKIRIPLMIQDPATSINGVKRTEGFDPENEEFFLDGPITDRIAILDFSPENGELERGAIFRPPPPGRVLGSYMDEEGRDVYRAEGEEIYSPAFIQVSAFAAVLKTMYLFEGTGERKIDTLGRPLRWAFDAAQLLVVPRAGQQANAYYHRDSNSLQFFYFPSPLDRDRIIYTGLSRDIVAHETGHAIVDGIAPDLLDACTPQSLAIHEAIADLTALLMAFDSHNLRESVLKKTGGSLEKPSEFSSIAEEFGTELRRVRKGLRTLYNDRNLDPDDPENCVVMHEPHALSEVLSGALYRVMIKIHEGLKEELAKKPEYSQREDPVLSASGEALGVGARRFRRMIFRALDYMPSGEVSFADYGRAIMAVDLVAYPDDKRMRDWVREEFVRRHIVTDGAALEAEVDFGEEGFIPDISNLYESDWAAYEFANRKRSLLFIPDGVQFMVRPRLFVRKKYDKDTEVCECIFKVAWDHTEENLIGFDFPEKRRITVGTTLAVRWDTGKILARLTNAPPADAGVEGDERGPRVFAEKEYREQFKARNDFLLYLADEGLLKLGRRALGPDGRPLISAVQAEEVGGAMRTRGTGRMLHMIGEWEG